MNMSILSAHRSNLPTNGPKNCPTNRKLKAEPLSDISQTSAIVPAPTDIVTE